MIVHPPEDLQELKTLVENFYKDNPINLDIVEDEVKKHRSIAVGEIKERDVVIRFYRESSKLPRNWQPNETYMNTDRLEHHGDDCIAGISYSDSSPIKYYSTMKKSKDRANYGGYIEGLDYEDDKIVRQRGKDGMYK